MTQKVYVYRILELQGVCFIKELLNISLFCKSFTVREGSNTNLWATLNFLFTSCKSHGSKYIHTLEILFNAINDVVKFNSLRLRCLSVANSFLAIIGR